jgi:hypothetical protein
MGIILGKFGKRKMEVEKVPKVNFFEIVHQI